MKATGEKAASASRPESMPQFITPMLAKAGKAVPDGVEFAYEIKWDGVRAIAFIRNGRISLQSRNLLDMTAQYPEIGELPRHLPRNSALILDGEIVALGENGAPSFSRLQQRMGQQQDARVRARMASVSVTYILFDLLYANGRSLMNLPYVRRRELLSALALNGPYWQTPPYLTGDAGAILRAARSHKLEGIVAKRLLSSYQPGARTGDWIKIKQQRRQELLIGGWLPGEGSRLGQIGALLTGYFDCTLGEAVERNQPQRLVYAGKCGTGFTDEMLKRLAKLLKPLTRPTNPFEVHPPRYRNAVYCEPQLVGEFEFSEWTHQDMLRHLSFKGLRQDKEASEAVREDLAEKE